MVNDGVTIHDSRPNIVFILVDDLGINDVGYHNRTASGALAGRKIISPNIDKMADSGLKIPNYCAPPHSTLHPFGRARPLTGWPAGSDVQEMCTPTRAALMTGRYPFRFGMTAFTIGGQEPWGIPLNETFLPQLMKAQGYATAAFGKW